MFRMSQENIIWILCNIFETKIYLYDLTYTYIDVNLYENCIQTSWKLLPGDAHYCYFSTFGLKCNIILKNSLSCRIGLSLTILFYRNLKFP